MRSEPWGPALAIGIGALVGVTGLIWEYVLWTRTRYYTGPQDIRYETGVLSREARSVPYERIQDVSLEERLIPRLFGMAEVKFETGAGGGDDLALQYLSLAEGERLRELVRARADDAGTQDAKRIEDEPGPGSAPQSRLLFAMGPRRLFTFGLFEFSLAVFAILLGAAQQFDFLIPFDIWEGETWERMLGQGGETLGRIGLAGQAISALIGLTVVISLGVLTGLIRTLLRDWDFRLERTAKGFRRRRGLTTKTDVVMPVHRVQAARIGTRLIRRFFGWHDLKFISLAQDSGSSSHAVAPFAKLAEIDPLLREAGLVPPDRSAAWQRAGKRLWIDRFFLICVPITVASVSIGWNFGALPALAIAVPLVSLAAITQFLSHRRQAFRIADGQIFLRHGLLAPIVTLGRQIKLQSVEIEQGPLGRLGGYAQVQLGVAGGSMGVRGLSLADAHDLRDQIMQTIAGTSFADAMETSAR
jgi:putative membrane protein